VIFENAACLAPARIRRRDNDVFLHEVSPSDGCVIGDNFPLEPPDLPVAEEAFRAIACDISNLDNDVKTRVRRSAGHQPYHSRAKNAVGRCTCDSS